MLVAEVCIYILYFSRSRINILYSSATRRAWDVFYHTFRHQPSMKMKFLLILCDAKRNQSDLVVIFPFAWIWSHRENLMRTSGISTISVVPCWCWCCGFFVLFSTETANIMRSKCKSNVIAMVQVHFRYRFDHFFHQLYSWHRRAILRDKSLFSHFKVWALWSVHVAFFVILSLPP